MRSHSAPGTAQRTLDSAQEFAACRDQFFATPLADTVIPWCFPGQSRAQVREQTLAFRGTEDFQYAYVDPLLQRVLRDTAAGLHIAGLEQLDRERKYLFICNHRCIVTDAALVSLNLLSSGRGTCKVCVGDNLMASPGVAELMLLLNGVVIKRSGARRDVYAGAQQVAHYLARQIAEQRYSVWLSQSPGRTKDGNDHTDPAIIKMLALAGARSAADFAQLHIVPVAISYEYEPCAVAKVRETLLRRRHGNYQKAPGEDLAQIRASLVADKGRVQLAFGQELQLAELAPEHMVAQVVAQIDAQIWQLYRCWDSHHTADALLRQVPGALDSTYAQSFAAQIAHQAQQLAAMGLDRAEAQQALLQLYAQPLRNAQGSACAKA